LLSQAPQCHHDGHCRARPQLYASRELGAARALVWTVIAGEAIYGIAIDIYKLAHGYPMMPPVPWIIIHSVIIATGILALRSAARRTSR